LIEAKSRITPSTQILVKKFTPPTAKSTRVPRILTLGKRQEKKETRCSQEDARHLQRVIFSPHRSGITLLTITT
jgi:hypothetical protein